MNIINKCFELLKKNINYIEQYKKIVKRWKNSTGKTLMLKYLDGTQLSASQAIAAKCADCLCGYNDGLEDCEDALCPLYIYMPYGVGKNVRKKKRSTGNPNFGKKEQNNDN